MWQCATAPKTYIFYANRFLSVLLKKSRNNLYLKPHDTYVLFITFFSQVNNKQFFFQVGTLLDSFNNHIVYLILLINVLVTLASFYHCMMMPSDEEQNVLQEFCNFSIGQLIGLLKTIDA